MVKSWYMSSIYDDERNELHLNPPSFVTIEELNAKTGVLCWKVWINECLKGFSRGLDMY